MTIIHVPRLPRPIARLCWKEAPTLSLIHCDRKYGHKGPHSWEINKRLTSKVGTRLE